MTKTTPEQMLEDCVEASTARNHPFNEWELGFIRDLESNYGYDENFEFTPARMVKLEQIWDKL